MGCEPSGVRDAYGAVSRVAGDAAVTDAVKQIHRVMPTPQTCLAADQRKARFERVCIEGFTGRLPTRAGTLNFGCDVCQPLGAPFQPRTCGDRRRYGAEPVGP